MNNKLVEGEIKFSNLSKWFKVSECTFFKNKEKYLEELKQYCEYHIIKQNKKSKLFIDKVYIEEYVPVKNSNKKIIDKYFYDYFNVEQPFNSSLLSKRLYEDHKDELTIKYSTVHNYFNMKKMEEFGHNPTVKRKAEGGEKGYVTKEWCKGFYDKHIRWEFLTLEEQKEKKKLWIELYNESEEMLNAIEEYESGDINEDEFAECSKQIFLDLYYKLKEKLIQYCNCDDVGRIPVAHNWERENNEYTL